MRVAFYARVSTQRQAQAQTVEQQLDRRKSHASEQNWRVPVEHILRDDGHSGASLKRPGLDRLRDHAAARQLDLVLITAPDRLARNYVHQVLLLEELEQHGCRVQFLDRPMSQDPHDQLLLQIRGAVAEYERTLITERMRRGRQRKLQAGLLLPWTRPPYGYRTDPERPRDPAGVRIEESEAAIVRQMFAWYAEDSHSFCSLARLLHERGIRTSTGLARWNLASLRGLLTNPAYVGLVYGNRWHRRGSLERRSATAPRQHSAFSRINAPREEWILAAQIPALVSQEQFDRVQARLVTNRRFAHRNNKVHPYLLRNLVSCGVCGLSCLARTTIHDLRYYSCTGKLPALFSHREQKCPSRLSPAERLDQLVWDDLCAIVLQPEQITQALERAHGGCWLPQELQARQEGLRRGQASLTQQLDRLTEAYLAGVVLLEEYRRRRSDLERRLQVLEQQQCQLVAQVDRRQELAGLSRSIEDFCERIRTGLRQATFDQKRKLVELLIDRVIVSDGEVEIRYVMPTCKNSEQIRFCHLQLDYRTGPSPNQATASSDAGLEELPNRRGGHRWH
jgi:site-specific DNA recombinase